MLVRNGGKRFNYVTVKVDPNSDAAMSESLVPITQIGFANVTDSLIKLIRQDIDRDPAGTNTKVKFYRRAKINGRVCTRISVLHATPDPVLEFAEANAFVDDELHVPIRVEAAALAQVGRRSQAPALRVHVHGPAAQRGAHRRRLPHELARREVSRPRRPSSLSADAPQTARPAHRSLPAGLTAMHLRPLPLKPAGGVRRVTRYGAFRHARRLTALRAR